jgi:hypothetical protein
LRTVYTANNFTIIGSIRNGAAFFRPAKIALLSLDDDRKSAQKPEINHRQAELALFLRDSAVVEWASRPYCFAITFARDNRTNKS